VAGRPRTVSKNARATSVSYTPAERMALHVISENRKSRNEKRTTTNEIVVDAIWHLLETAEHRTRVQIETLLPPAPPEVEKTQIKIMQMQKPKKKR
jgi:hypothetical protein